MSLYISQEVRVLAETRSVRSTPLSRLLLKTVSFTVRVGCGVESGM